MTTESQAFFQWPDTPQGTTLDARTFVVEINGSAPSNVLSAVSVVFAKNGAATLTPAVTITNAATWAFTVGPVAAADMGLADGVHTFDIETTDAAGNVKKYVAGEIKILPSPQ